MRMNTYQPAAPVLQPCPLWFEPDTTLEEIQEKLSEMIKDLDKQAAAERSAALKSKKQRRFSAQRAHQAKARAFAYASKAIFALFIPF